MVGPPSLWAPAALPLEPALGSSQPCISQRTHICLFFEKFSFAHKTFYSVFCLIRIFDIIILIVLFPNQTWIRGLKKRGNNSVQCSFFCLDQSKSNEQECPSAIFVLLHKRINVYKMVLSSAFTCGDIPSDPKASFNDFYPPSTRIHSSESPVPLSAYILPSFILKNKLF